MVLRNSVKETIRDRVVQTSAMLVLEPIFEADLPKEQYAYRADRSALDAVQHVHKLINTGHGQIVDVEMRSQLAIERAGLVTLHLQPARRSSIPTINRESKIFSFRPPVKSHVINLK
jgi:hypothetical protein